MLQNNAKLRQARIATGFVGLLAAIMTGAGEFLLHFDAANRYADGTVYLSEIGVERINAGHFLGSLAAPLYLVGTIHLYLMLRSASERWAGILAALLGYSFVIAAIWLGSRASLHALAVAEPSQAISTMQALYDLRYETLLNFARVGVLAVSAIFAWLVVKGPTPYPRWMALVNPILLIGAAFVLWFTLPMLGKFIMPIALNVAFAILFAFSTNFALNESSEETFS